MIRPGPESIAAGECPGGVVLHVYACTVPPLLLLTRKLTAVDDLNAAAVADRLTAAGFEEVCIVGFDGDTGERYSLQEVMHRWTV